MPGRCWAEGDAGGELDAFPGPLHHVLHCVELVGRELVLGLIQLLLCPWSRASALTLLFLRQQHGSASSFVVHESVALTLGEARHLELIG